MYNVSRGFDSATCLLKRGEVAQGETERRRRLDAIADPARQQGLRARRGEAGVEEDDRGPVVGVSDRATCVDELGALRPRRTDGLIDGTESEIGVCASQRARVRR